METPKSQVEERLVTVIQGAVGSASPAERVALAEWATALLAIRESESSVKQKIKSALAATAKSDVAKPIVKALAREGKAMGKLAKAHLWDNRGIVGRMALSGVALGTAVFGGEGAGIAAFGGAIGVPLWLVIGGGGAVLGSLIEELRRSQQPDAAYEVIDVPRVERR